MSAYSQMQLRIFPIRKSPLAPKTRAGKVGRLVIIESYLNVFADDEMFALFAKACLVQTPPLGVTIVLIEKS